MSWFQWSTTHRIVLIGIMAFLNAFFYSEAAQAQWWRPSSWFSRSSNWGPPRGNYTGAAHRGGRCPRVDIPLTALAPVHATEDGSQFIVGATASDYPTLWFYLPYEIGDPVTDTTKQQRGNSLESKPIAELRLEEQDPQTQEISQRVVTTLPPTNPGVIGVRLPSTEPPLAVGKTYRWVFVVRCDPHDSSTNQFTEISLHRVQTPSFVNASLEQQFNVYLQNGLWAEMMSLCDRWHRTSSDPALLAAWSNTIQEVPLDAIDPQRVVAACRTGQPKLMN